jgi:hypothetical protein
MTDPTRASAELPEAVVKCVAACDETGLTKHWERLEAAIAAALADAEERGRRKENDADTTFRIRLVCAFTDSMGENGETFSVSESIAHEVSQGPGEKPWASVERLVAESIHVLIARDRIEATLPPFQFVWIRARPIPAQEPAR